MAAAPPLTSSLAASDSWDWEDLRDRQVWLDQVGARQAWSQSTGSGVKIAVLDSGVDGTHPVLAGRVAAGLDLAVNDREPLEAGTDSASRLHGTAVAAVAAGAVFERDSVTVGLDGVAPGATIVPVRVSGPYDQDWAALAHRTVLGARWAVEQAGAQVVVMSYGVPYAYYDSVCSELERLSEQAVLVAAAGNLGAIDSAASAYANTLPLPAGCPAVLTVSGVDARLQPAYFTSYGPDTDLAAPSEMVLTAIPSSLRPSLPVGQLNGTSMAAPMVAGVAALVWAQHPEWSAAQVRARLLATARDLNTPGFDVYSGSGLVDAAAAVGLDPTSAPVDQTPALYNPRAATGGGTQVAWSVPEDLEFDSFTVRVRAPGYDVSTVLDGGAVRATIAVPFSSDVVVTLRATTSDDRTLRSAPAGAPVSENTPAMIAHLTPAWASTSTPALRVTLAQVGTLAPGSSYTLRLAAAGSTRSTTITTDGDGRLAPTATFSNLPRSWLSTSVRAVIDGTVNPATLAPRYKIALKVQRYGSTVVVTGSVYGCTTCSGRTVTLTDPSNGRKRYAKLASKGGFAVSWVTTRLTASRALRASAGSGYVSDPAARYRY